MLVQTIYGTMVLKLRKEINPRWIYLLLKSNPSYLTEKLIKDTPEIKLNVSGSVATIKKV
jgi:hypothetical protein